MGERTKLEKRADMLRLLMLGALEEAENALVDYIAQLEAKGAILNYGHSVLRQVRTAITSARESAT